MKCINLWLQEVSSYAVICEIELIIVEHEIVVRYKTCENRYKEVAYLQKCYR